MKNILKLSFLCLLFISSSLLKAQSVNIELNLKKGDSYTSEMQMTNEMKQEMMGQSIDMKQDMVVKMITKVSDKLENGNYLMEQIYTQMKIDMLVNGQNMSMDTEGSEDNPQTASLKKLKEVVITYEVSPKGKVSNAKGFEEMMNALQGNQQAGQMLQSFTNDNTLSSTYSYIPQEKVKVGDSYVATIKMQEMMGMEIDSKYVVLKINSDHVNLSLNTDIAFSPDKPIEQNGMSLKMKGSGKQSGTFNIDRKTGMPISSDVVQDIKMEMSFKNPQSGEDMTIPMDVKSVVKMTFSKN